MQITSLKTEKVAAQEGRTEKIYGKDLGVHRDNPDFELIRMIRASELLKEAFEMDPRDPETSGRQFAVEQSDILEEMIIKTPAKTLKGLRAKVDYAWTDYDRLGTSCTDELISGTFENVIQFLDVVSEEKIAA